MRETIRSGGRRRIIGGHHGTRRKDEKDGREYDRKKMEAQLDKLTERETREEILSNWKMMQGKFVLPPRDSDELSQAPVWEKETYNSLWFQVS